MDLDGQRLEPRVNDFEIVSDLHTLLYFCFAGRPSVNIVNN